MFTDDHRHFIQYMLKHGAVTKPKAFSVFTNLELDVDDDDGLDTLLTQINRKISRQNFKIVRVVCEVTGEELLIWLNMRNDSISKHQNYFTPAGLEYFQTLMIECLQSVGKRLPLNVCLNLSSNLPNSAMSKTDAQKLVQKWIKSGYLVKLDGNVYLGPRCIHEFASYFREQDNLLSLCSLCSELIVLESKCGICDTVFHKTCINRFLRGKPICPNCKNQWEEADDE